MAGLTAGTTVVAIVTGLVIDGGAFSAEAGLPAATAQVTSAPTPTATISMPTVITPAVPIIRSTVLAADGAPAGPVTGGTLVTVTGTDLEAVTSASFGAQPAQVVSVTADTVTLQTPAATDLGAVPVTLFTGTGEPVQVAGGISASGDPAASSSAATAALAQAVEPAIGASIAAATPAAEPTTPSLTFTYLPDPRITAQIDYALAHWQDYNTEVYGSIAGNDCVNFTSQSLIARGWTMDAEWSFSAGQYSAAWASSTVFAAYLSAHPERATPLTAAQRSEVKVGDIVQFDWDDSGDKDHTGIVTRVENTASGVQVYYAGHTNNTDYRSVDESLALAGGSVSYWSVV
ncbi:CHAP domain-containing protein [Cryobacterium lactosi]|uniref:CHAP domain-containing protein n=1 Tax=Cryobacterium lactosi TaxID=1259202 RepID=A0A4R9BGK3_9MICO|nr:amidase domain-containing protein [Cryobacterium lactosi]TFD83716.1 CHAP domain-containing protein [Cryobacterium lactosi]